GRGWMGAGEATWSFLVAAIPGSLMLAGGVSSLLLPGDPRTPQLTALGAFCALIAALPLLLMIGLTTFALLALAAAAFVACGWAAPPPAPPPARVPPPAPRP